jgi:phage shock protein A
LTKKVSRILFVQSQFNYLFIYMFSRLGRIIQSFFNRFLTVAENPVMILEHNIREIQTQIPKLNESVARSHGAVIMLQKQLGKYMEESQTLDSQVKAALKLGDENAARTLIVQLQDVKVREEKTGKDLDLSQQNLQQTIELRDLKVREINQQIKEVKGAIEEHRFSEMQRQIAEVTDSSASIDVNSVSNSTQEMLAKLQQQTALNQGTFAASMSNSQPAIQASRIEKEAKLIQADELLLKYKQDLGLTSEQTTVDAEITK